MGLRLDFLGTFKLGGNPVSPQVLGRKAIGALAILALSPEGIVSRTVLAGLLWSDRGEDQARDSLRQVLSSMRRAFNALDAEPLVADRENVTLLFGDCDIDIHSFQTLVNESTREAKSAAIKLYSGPLLDGLSINDNAFQEWLLRERARVDASATTALEWLLFSTDADPAAAEYLDWANCLAEIDGLNEAAARGRMLHFGAHMELAKAAQEYDRLKRALLDELGVPPSQETIRVFEKTTTTTTETRRAPVAPVSQIAPIETRGGPQRQPRAMSSVTRFPRIAVLPLRNLSGNPDEGFFVDGVTEDIVVSLSSFRAIRVISSQSSFGFREQAVDPTTVAQTLDASYLVSGSLRRSTERIRINVELIAGETGENVWASRFDRELKDIFEIQESIARSVVTCVAGQIERTATARQRRKATDDLSAYELVLRGNEKLHQVRWHDNIQARDFYRSALSLDPEFARAHTGMALAVFDAVFMGWDANTLLSDGVEHASRAAELDPIDGHAQLALGMLKFLQRDYASSEFHLQSAHRLNESDADIMIYFAIFLLYDGQPDFALRWIDRAIGINPLHPEYYFTVKGTALFGAGQYAASLKAYSQRHNHDRLVLAYMAASAFLSGNEDEMERHLAELRDSERVLPRESKPVSSLLVDEIGLYRHDADQDRLASSFRQIGLLQKLTAH